jgi:hypothetical protein
MYTLNMRRGDGTDTRNTSVKLYVCSSGVYTRARARGCIQKFPDWVDNEIYAYKNKHSLRSNTKGYGGKTLYTDSQNSDTNALSGRELYHLQFSLQAASPETFWYTLVYVYVYMSVCMCVCVHIYFLCSIVSVSLSSQAFMSIQCRQKSIISKLIPLHIHFAQS